MKYNGESTSIPNVDRLRHHWSTLSSQGARLHIASAKITYFGLSKSVNYVPDENICKTSNGLCIRRSNLKYLDCKIGDVNLKNIGYPNCHLASKSIKKKLCPNYNILKCIGYRRWCNERWKRSGFNRKFKQRKLKKGRFAFLTKRWKRRGILKIWIFFSYPVWNRSRLTYLSCS